MQHHEEIMDTLDKILYGVSYYHTRNYWVWKLSIIFVLIPFLGPILGLIILYRAIKEATIDAWRGFTVQIHNDSHDFIRGWSLSRDTFEKHKAIDDRRRGA
jgi:hypothetical protein